jgi:hypothetical protein
MAAAFYLFMCQIYLAYGPAVNTFCRPRLGVDLPLPDNLPRSSSVAPPGKCEALLLQLAPVAMPHPPSNPSGRSHRRRYAVDGPSRPGLFTLSPNRPQAVRRRRPAPKVCAGVWSAVSSAVIHHRFSLHGAGSKAYRGDLGRRCGTRPTGERNGDESPGTASFPGRPSKRR